MADVKNQTMSMEDGDNQSERKALLLRLDEMLEEYLHMLDRYQKAQQQLSTFFSDGFLSLAQANFNNQSRTRYGQDYYDERMHALRKIYVTDQPSISFTLCNNKPSVSNSASLPQDSTDALEEPSSHGKETPSNSDSASSHIRAEPEEPEKNSTSEEKPSSDPIRWFGILVPSSLRSSQSSFISAVEGPIPEIATLINDIRKKEIDIGRLRKQIRKV